MGQETEYATRTIDRSALLAIASEPRATAIESYHAIREAMCGVLPGVPAVHDAEQRFLANGALLGLETSSSNRDQPGGLIEMATPEVRRPSEMVACQRAVDEVLCQAVAAANVPSELRVLKSTWDGAGHVFGCQENYEVDVACGLGLVVYRASMIGLWAVAVGCQLLSLPCVLMLVFVVGLQTWWSQRYGSAPKQDPGEENDERDLEQAFHSLPKWFSETIIALLRLTHWPLVLGLRFIANHIAFRSQRKLLAPFLVSRISLCGAGHLDADGCFYVCGKSLVLDRVSDMGGFQGERPMFVFGHWLGRLCGRPLGTWGAVWSLLARRQRLQIGVSDSNLCDLAQWVKTGSLSLILDMIEAGETDRFPVIAKPLAALHEFNRDWHLVRRVKTSQGEFTSLELQLRYWRAARVFVDKRGAMTNSPNIDEAEIVLEKWWEAIQAVKTYRRNGNLTKQGLGRVDWLGKRWMLDQLGADADVAAKHKIDLRYHELSPEGYYRRFEAEHPEARLVDDEDIAGRMRSPPADTPASRRGWMIREFANTESHVRADWAYAIVGEGSNQRRVLFRTQPDESR